VRPLVPFLEWECLSSPMTSNAKAAPRPKCLRRVTAVSRDGRPSRSIAAGAKPVRNEDVGPSAARSGCYVRRRTDDCAEHWQIRSYLKVWLTYALARIPLSTWWRTR
jgi:hypothetical protein